MEDKDKKAVKKAEKVLGVSKTKKRAYKPKKSARIPDVIYACVLKSGGDYTPEYVEKLYNMVSRHTMLDFDFVCLTDMKIEHKDIKVVPLKEDWPGWWSKIELFRKGLFTGPVVYFDLDTLILSNTSMLFPKKREFYMLKGFRKPNDPMNYGSGVMAWNGDYSVIYSQYKKKYRTRSKRGGDQAFIRDILFEYCTPPLVVQSKLSVKSFKRHFVEETGPPIGTEVLCFHGRPRPHETDSKWVKGVWK